MTARDAARDVLEGLLRKYEGRRAKNIVTSRRVLLRPAEVYRDYDKNNADISSKQAVNEAVDELARRGFVTTDRLKYSEDVEKIYLVEEKAGEIYGYLGAEYGVAPRGDDREEARMAAERYRGMGEITGKYRDAVLGRLEDARYHPRPGRVEANFKMLRFLEENRERLYVREASMMAYGDSKWFEENNYEEICDFLWEALGKEREEGERKDAVLGEFLVVPPEQDIFLKGDWALEWEDGASWEISGREGGIALSSADLPGIRRVRLGEGPLMTIENKTSFRRMRGRGAALMYLGGFASRPQITFLQKAVQDNPAAECLHFGDIDIGGFLIHRHLCREVGKTFGMYCMGVPQLREERFAHCRKPLTENDRVRLDALAQDPAYREVLSYMKEHDVKLEQEIVSYALMSRPGDPDRDGA